MFLHHCSVRALSPLVFIPISIKKRKTLQKVFLFFKIVLVWIWNFSFVHFSRDRNCWSWPLFVDIAIAISNTMIAECTTIQKSVARINHVTHRAILTLFVTL